MMTVTTGVTERVSVPGHLPVRCDVSGGYHCLSSALVLLSVVIMTMVMMIVTTGVTERVSVPGHLSVRCDVSGGHRCLPPAALRNQGTGDEGECQALHLSLCGAVLQTFISVLHRQHSSQLNTKEREMPVIV